MRLPLHGVASVSPFNGEADVGVSASITATFDFDADPATVNASSVELRNPQGTLIPATVSYNGPSRTATLIPTSPLADVADYYTATVIGGPGGVEEAATGEPIESDFRWHFITETPTYQDSVILSGLQVPTAVEFASDGRVFVAEKSGIIKVFDDLSDTTATTFADLRTNVHNFWDRGLLGMALHPNFPATPDLYVLYTYDAEPGGAAPRWGNPDEDSDGCPNPPGATNDGCVVSGRLSRLTVNPDNTWDGNETVLIEDWGQQFPSHSIGSLAFGADGYLYASGGDGASFNFVDYGQAGDPINPLGDPPVPIGGTQNPPTAEGGALRSQDLQSTGDPVTLDGSIIRVDPNTGLALPDNPLFGDSDPNAQRIVAYGLRNPFRFTIRPGTSEVWLGDVGWSKWEEINVIRDPTDTLVENFGWPAYEGAEPQASYDNANLNLLENLYANPDPDAHIEPFFAYDHSEQVIPGSSEPTGSSSISGLAFSEGGNLPAPYDGALFFSDFSRDSIWVMFRSPDGEPDPASRAHVLSSAAGPVQLSIGPGGDLFYVDINGGNIRRIRFISSDQPPMAVAQADVQFGSSPLTVNFDGTTSSDPNPGDPLTYAWDLDGDGQLDDSTSPQPSFNYSVSGIYTVTLEVTDSTGLTDTDTLLIGVDNFPPSAVIDTPLPSLNWQVNDVISFTGHATDPDVGTLPATALDWDVILHHCPGGVACHTHFVTNFPGTDNGSFNAPDHEYPSHLELRLTATDATGLQDTDSILLFPQTVEYTIDSVPSGLQLSLGSVTDATPFTQTVIVGSNNSVSAASLQLFGQESYEFVSWSDGGAQSHNFVAASGPQTLVATYQIGATQPTDTTDDGTGTITAQGENGTFEGMAQAFDNDSSTKWLDFAPANPTTRASWIQYQYANGDRYTVTSYTIASANDAPERDPRDWTLLGSNDGVNFTPLDARSDEFFTSRFQTRQFAFPNNTAYNIYRLEIDSVADPASANSMQLAEIELIGVPEGGTMLPIMAVSATDDSAGEGSPADPGEFTIFRSGSTTGSLTVNYTISGTATAGDYTELLSGSVLVPDGVSSVVLPITPVNDTEEEGAETLQLTLTSGSGYTVGLPDSALITIADDDVVNPPFDTTDDGAGTITAQGENGFFEGASQAFDNDSGTKWLDFATANPSTRASWIQYQYAASDQYIVSSYTITSANDAPERDPLDWQLLGSDDGVNFTVIDTRTSELFTSRFQQRSFPVANTTGYNIYRLDIQQVADPANANSIQLAEIELVGLPGTGSPPLPTVSISATDNAADEEGLDPGQFTITRDDTQGDLTVFYTLGGTADAADYTETLSGAVVIPDGSGAVTIDVTPIDDPDIEGAETLLLTLSSDSAYTIGTPSSDSLTIADNDDPPVVSISATDNAADEEGLDPGQFTITRDDTSGDLTVFYTLGGTADAADYSETLTGTVTILDGSNTAVVDVTPIDDPDIEGAETLLLTLASDAAYTIGTPNSDAVTIADNDQPPITPTDTTDDGTGTITAQGENGTFEGMAQAFDNDSSTKWLDFAPANPTTRASWIQYQYANGDRYTVTSYTIASANDAPERDPRDWTLLGSNDGVNFTPLDARSDEFFTSRFQTRQFAFPNNTAYNIYRLEIDSVADPASANSMQLAEIELIGVPEGGTMLPIMAVSATDDSAGEGSPADPGEFTIFRSGSTTGSLTVNYTISGTATAGDYTELLSGSVLVPDGVSSVVLPITPVNDTEEEGAETLQLTLTSGSGYTVGLPDSALITIADDDVVNPPFDTTDDGAGTITAQGENGFFEGASQAFDNDSGTKWLDFATANPSTRASWIQYQYAASDQYIVSSYTITSANDAPERDPLDWQLLGSDDGVNFTVIDTRTSELFTSRFQQRSFPVANTTGYNIYRLDIQQVADPANANSIQLAEIELVGLPGTGSPPAASASSVMGDMDGDTLVNLNDVAPFIMALTNRAVFDAAHPGVDADQLGDVDGSGKFDLGDIGAFTQLFGPAAASSSAASHGAEVLAEAREFVFASTAPVARLAVSDNSIEARTRTPSATADLDSVDLISLLVGNSDGRLPVANRESLFTSKPETELTERSQSEWDETLLAVLDSALF